VIVAGEVLAGRLLMARELKALTGSAHDMTGSKLDDLRSHIKVCSHVISIVTCAGSRA